MIQFFRILVIFAVAIFVAATLLPLGHPVHIQINLNSPPPAEIILAPISLLVGIATLVAAVGLLLLRRWGQWLGLIVLACWLATFSLALATSFGAALTISAKVLFALFAIAWLSSLLVSRHPSVVARFRRAH